MRGKLVVALSGFAAGLGLALVPGCGAPKKCDPVSCTGCCDSTGACQPGMMATACGANGAACALCQPGISCLAGSCGGSGGGAGGGGGGQGGGGGTCKSNGAACLFGGECCSAYCFASKCSGKGTFQVSKTAVGDPAFDVVDWQQISVTAGTRANQFAQLPASLRALLPKHDHLPSLNIYPSSLAHPGPYPTEWSGGALDAGVSSKVQFARADWTAPKAILLGAMVVPRGTAVTGSSLDSDDGPIIAPGAFPLSIDADFTSGGAVVDPHFDSQYPAITQMDPSRTGWSHVPLLFVESTESIPDAGAGTYEWTVRFRAANGTGWDMTVGPLVMQ